MSDGWQSLVDERACESVVLEFVHHLDLGEPGDVAELFVEDGVWEWPQGGRRIEGRQALRTYFGGRRADRLSRRLMSNVLVTLGGPNAATATSYFTTYRVDGWSGDGYLPARPPTQVGHYEDELVRTDQGWRLVRRRLHLAFGGETERVAG